VPEFLSCPTGRLKLIVGQAGVTFFFQEKKVTNHQLETSEKNKPRGCMRKTK